MFSLKLQQALLLSEKSVRSWRRTRNPETQLRHRGSFYPVGIHVGIHISGSYSRCGHHRVKSLTHRYGWLLKTGKTLSDHDGLVWSPFGLRYAFRKKNFLWRILLYMSDNTGAFHINTAWAFLKNLQNAYIYRLKLTFFSIRVEICLWVKRTNYLPLCLLGKGPSLWDVNKGSKPIPAVVCSHSTSIYNIYQTK